MGRKKSAVGSFTLGMTDMAAPLLPTPAPQRRTEHGRSKAGLTPALSLSAALRIGRRSPCEAARPCRRTLARSTLESTRVTPWPWPSAYGFALRTPAGWTTTELAQFLNSENVPASACSSTRNGMMLSASRGSRMQWLAYHSDRALGASWHRRRTSAGLDVLELFMLEANGSSDAFLNARFVKMCTAG